MPAERRAAESDTERSVSSPGPEVEGRNGANQPAGAEPVAAPPPPPELTGPDGARRRASQLRRALAAGDWLALIFALCIATVSTPAMDIGTLFWAVVLSPGWIVIMQLHGLYDNDRRRIQHSTIDELPTLLLACALGTLALDVALSLTPPGALNASGVLIIATVSFLGTAMARAIIRTVYSGVTVVARGAIVGRNRAAEMVARRLTFHPEARLQLVGYIGASSDGPDPSFLPRLGGVADIARVAEEHGLERIVLTDEDGLTEAQAEELIEDCKIAGLSLTFLPRHFRLLGPGIELNRLAELPVLDFRFAAPTRATLLMKRALDLVVSSLLLLVLAPLFAVVAVVIRIDSPGPVFFRQMRAGKDGMPFRMVKFRTMVVDAEERLSELIDIQKLDEPTFKLHNDPRVTRAGRYLRRFSIDELPQFINVFLGGMSLVGPRPEEESIVALYDERQRIRLAVKPGVTGPMQVYGRADLSFEERLALERDYLDNLSITGDIAILLRTPRAVVLGGGAY